MVSSSSTKKAARLAQKGKGKKVRFQGGTLFPLVVLAVLVVGLGTIVYARQSVPAGTPPTIDDHWHMAYGLDLCDMDGQQQVTGAAEEQSADGSQLLNVEYQRLGVHSHDDGIIHWHAFTSAATGSSAEFGDFLDVYGIELTNDELTFPPAQLGGGKYVEGETKCGDEDGKLVVAKWDNFTDTGAPTIYTAAFDDIKISEDAAVYVVAFIPESEDPEDIVMPPWAPQLPELGAADGGTQPEGGSVDSEGNFIPNPVPAGTEAPTGTDPAGSTVPAASSPGSAPASSVPGSTTPADEATTTTLG